MEPRARNQAQGCNAGSEVGTLFGYMGTMLRVDLTDRTVKEEPIDLETARAFIGGAGYAARIIHDEVSGRHRPARTGQQAGLHDRPLDGDHVPHHDSL